jgi:5'-3' exonuclease
MHKSTFSCATDLCMGRPTDKLSSPLFFSLFALSASRDRWLTFLKRRVELLVYHKVRPVLVFDGGALPMKAETNEARRVKRQAYLAQGKQLMEAGNTAAAEQCFRKATSISWDMMRCFQNYLSKEGVEWLVAPYEADAQLAFLSRNGWVDAIVTEDSDLLAFGCGTVLYKLDKAGQCKQVKFADLGSIAKPAMANFDLEMFRAMCILSGCDYVKQLPGIGLVKAHELVVRHRTLEGALAALKADKKRVVPEGYADRVRLAQLTFRHQRVWDHENNSLTTLAPMPADAFDGEGPENDCLGPRLSSETAYGVAAGMLHPHTHEPYDPAKSAAKNATPASAPPTRAPSNTIDKFFAATPRTRLTKSGSGSATAAPPNSAAASRVSAAQSSFATTLAKLEEFRSKQAEQQRAAEAEEKVLAPATPEKGSSGRKHLLRGLLDSRQRRDATPVRLVATPGKPLVVSPFFQGEGKDDSARRVLLAQFDDEDEEDAEEVAALIEEAASLAPEAPEALPEVVAAPASPAAAREVVANLLASSRARAGLKLKSLSRRSSNVSPADEEDEETRPSKAPKVDFSRFGYQRSDKAKPAD